MATRDSALIRQHALRLSAIAAAAAAVASASDAWFVARVGASQLGAALMISSLVLIVTAAYLGAAADRRGALSERAGFAHAVGAGLLVLIAADRKSVV